MIIMKISYSLPKYYESGTYEMEFLSSEERCEILGVYIVENNATVRDTAQKFSVSKSTVHKDVTEKLYHANRQLYKEVKAVLEKNKSERHLRGGEATKKKYQSQSNTIDNFSK